MAKDIEGFIQTIDGFCNLSFDIASYHRKEGRENGLAFYYYGRSISCFMGVKTLLFALNMAGSQANFAEEYIKSLPISFPKKDIEIAMRYIKETHMAIRFVLFQNFYSQTEFTLRIIQRELFPEDKKRNPFKLIAEKFGVFKDNAPDFLNDVRNTIHNNGHYFPSDGLDKKYNLFGKEFHFKVGGPIDDVTMVDILTIVEFILHELKQLFENNELSSIKFKD